MLFRSINGSSSSTHGQEHVQSITTLRSSKQVDNQVKMPEMEDDENIVLKEKGTHSSHDDHGEKEDNPPTTPIQDLSSLLDKRSVANPPQVFSSLVSWVIISLCSLYFRCYT